ncbi:hypothetical protein RND71_012600 [Anisodus tanguticus]|uniref:Pentatricopeptide repeat-containing protein n=1 Tax=Anisodus tanguticus TaxID=243964 RepID=A0AAE1SG68_9SOLA|nr:hypothetical protein RND71_012600 [Anisodus tanguticus]
MVVRTSVLDKIPLLIPQEDHNKVPEFNFSLKEQEWITMIKKCNNMKELKQVHGQILKLGFICSSFCADNLLSTCALSEWGSMDYACSIFGEISDPDGVEPDNFSYPALLKVCARFRALKDGQQIHGQIFKFGHEDDVFVQNSLINMYGKCGEIKESCIVFEQMDQRTIASWSALIAAHANLGLWSDCLKVFGEMNSEGCWRAEESTLNGKQEPDVLSAIISGLALHGRGEEALRIYHEMLKERLEPDDVVYVGILSACSHAGLVEEGLKCFDRMKLEHRIEPTIQHYGCMVDLLGRAGRFKETLELIKGMPMEPNDVLWRSLPSACRVHRNVELGKVAAKNLFQLNSRNANDCVMLCNMYAQAKMWEKMAEIRTIMVNEGISQVPGSCLVEVNRKFYKFVSQDRSHICNDEVYEMLHQIEWQLKFEGYSPDASLVQAKIEHSLSKAGNCICTYKNISRFSYKDSEKCQNV